MNNIISGLEKIAFVHWVAVLLVAVSGFLFYLWRYVKVQWRFGKNLRRKIYFIKTSEEKKLKLERDSLVKLKTFNLVEDIKDISISIKDLQALDRNAVYVVGYSSQYSAYKELVDSAKHDNIPIIIFADQGEIKPESGHWKIFNDYIYCDVANTTNRLAIILLNTLKIV
jgi:cell division protein FtsX